MSDPLLGDGPKGRTGIPGPIGVYVGDPRERIAKLRKTLEYLEKQWPLDRARLLAEIAELERTI